MRPRVQSSHVRQIVCHARVEEIRAVFMISPGNEAGTSVVMRRSGRGPTRKAIGLRSTFAARQAIAANSLDQGSARIVSTSSDGCVFVTARYESIAVPALLAELGKARLRREKARRAE